MHPTGSYVGHEVVMVVGVLFVTALLLKVFRLRKLIDSFNDKLTFAECAREALQHAHDAEHLKYEYMRKMYVCAARNARQDQLVLSVTELSNRSLQEHIRQQIHSCTTCGDFGLRPDECVIRQYPDADGLPLLVECNSCVASQHTAELRGTPLSALLLSDAEYQSRLKHDLSESLN